MGGPATTFLVRNSQTNVEYSILVNKLLLERSLLTISLFLLLLRTVIWVYYSNLKKYDVIKFSLKIKSHETVAQNDCYTTYKVEQRQKNISSGKHSLPPLPRRNGFTWQHKVPSAAMSRAF